MCKQALWRLDPGLPHHAPLCLCTCQALSVADWVVARPGGMSCPGAPSHLPAPRCPTPGLYTEAPLGPSLADAPSPPWQPALPHPPRGPAFLFAWSQAGLAAAFLQPPEGSSLRFLAVLVELLARQQSQSKCPQCVLSVSSLVQPLPAPSQTQPPSTVCACQPCEPQMGTQGGWHLSRP